MPTDVRGASREHSGESTQHYHRLASECFIRYNYLNALIEYLTAMLKWSGHPTLFPTLIYFVDTCVNLNVVLLGVGHNGVNSACFTVSIMHG